MARKQESVYKIKVLGLNDIKSLNTEIQKLNGNYDKLSKESKKASDSTKSVGSESKNSAIGLGKIAKGAAAATASLLAFNKISKAVGNQIKQSVQVFKGYEFAMAKVKAISGASTQEFIKLDKSAQALGRSTFFTAEQVANLQLNFSKLGFTSSEVLNVQEAALLAATATGEDLARTATVIGSTIRGFGLDASEGARVSDVVAASFTSSALTLEKFQTSMTKVSPVAKLLGMDLEETTAVMGVLTDAGIEASIAGTSLRNIFLKLGDPSSDLAKSIGFTVNSGEDMVREFRRMRDEGVNVEKMLKVVDVRQVAAISTMIEHIDKIEKQTEFFRLSQGAAEDMAAVIGDSLQGATLRFQSALDGLRIVLMEKIAPSLQTVRDGFASLFNKIASFSEVSMSEQLDKDRIAMNAQVTSILRLKEGTDEHKKAIIKLQKTYPDHFKNLDFEKTKNDDLTKALNNVNKQYIDKIVLMKKEEEVSAAAEKAASARFAARKAEQVANEEAIRLNEEYNLGVELRGLTVDEQFTAIENAFSKQFDYMDEERENLVLLSQQTLVYRQNTKEAEEFAKATEKLTEEKKKLAEQLGIELDDGTTVAGTTTPPPSSSDADTDEIVKKQADSMTAIMRATEEIVAEEKFKLQKQFLDGEIATREEYDEILLQKQSEFLSEALAMDILTTEERMKLTDMLHKVKMQQMKDEQKAEVDRIKQLKETGQLLLQIGEAEGENSKIKQAGIKITQAAAVAEGIQGLVNAQAAITKQASSGDPFTAFIRVASMAAMLASVIVNLKALIGGGGGEAGIASGEESGTTVFEKGGLTKGGMFKGASHANGGVKFRVGGTIHEAEGGEAIINKKSTARFRPILSAINSYNGNGVKFADGGIISQGEKFAMGGELRSVQSMISGSTTQKVVLVESDVTDTQNRISALESQSSF